LPFINKLFYYKETRKRFPYDISLFDALYPFHNKGFYFDLFGHRGFIAQQILIPEDSIFEFIKKFESIIKRADIPIVLSAIKAFRGEQQLLNFNGDGFSLYCDFLNNGDSIKFLDKFNDLATDYGCISNIIRNSYLSAEIVKNQYNQYNEFKDRLHNYDPDRLFVSEISNRLEL
jgi:decaprenylphospho-beta-D-ribofuranose 2-oxidase